MKKLIYIILFTTSCIFAQTEQNNKPKVSSIGLGTVTAFPNAAELTISFRHVKPTLRDAINENQKTSDEVLKIIKGFVKDTLDVKTSLIATDKSMVWDNKLKREVFVGFVSTQKIICISFYLPQVIKANVTLSKSLLLKYLLFSL